MSKFKLIVLFAVGFSLIGCDQVRDKLVNGFNWGGNKVDPINNNQRIEATDVLQPKNDIKDDQIPKKPSYDPLPTPNSNKPLAAKNTSPVPKSDKASPQSRTNDIGGFRDSDW